MTASLSPARTTTLAELRRTDVLDGYLSVPKLAQLVTSVAQRPELWRSLLRIPAPGEDRFWVRLPIDGTDGLVDIWLLAWLPGQTTTLHDHGGSLAAFTVVDGVLAEDRSRPEGGRRSFHRATGAVTGIPLGVRHDVTGAGDGPAISIHAYSPPLTRMNYFDDEGRLIRSVQTHEPEEELAR
jgi:predicted metal-dependent enzyme (double-stranded beta helix superfamily)